MHTRSDLQLIELQTDTLFVCDAAGRMRYSQEPGYEEAELDPAPRFFMGRTRHGHVWRFRHDLPDSLVSTLEQLCRTEPSAASLAEAEQPQTAAAIRAALQAHAPITAEERGPAYWIPDGLPTPAAVVPISETNAYLLAAHFSWAHRAQGGLRPGPIMAVVVQDRAVALGFCARLSPWAAEAGVNTLEAFRGRGYASAVVTAWASAIRQQGLLPLYSTSWQNVASQHVARKLGMVQYGEDWSIT